MMLKQEYDFDNKLYVPVELLKSIVQNNKRNC